IIDELGRLVRNNVDVRLVISRSCNCVRGGVGWRSVIYALVPVLVIALILAFYSPYVGVLTIMNAKPRPLGLVARCVGVNAY
ncbi:MAG: hypothetical protein AT718_11000, partial [Vulcanisaeta sp. JCHS_4]